MPLQNRVDPFGRLHAVPARGMFTGNRGVIHDPATRTLLKRRWMTRAWIICTCEFRGRRRDVMGRNSKSGNAGWTELFFLDEVTALAAGHRPCFYCQRERAKQFLDAFGAAFGIAHPTAPGIDERLHAERLASRTAAHDDGTANLEGLPDGTMVSVDGEAFSLRAGKALRWSFSGYAPAIDARELDGRSSLVTPQTTIAVLRQGYAPVWSDIPRIPPA